MPQCAAGTYGIAEGAPCVGITLRKLFSEKTENQAGGLKDRAGECRANPVADRGAKAAAECFAKA